MLQGFPFEHGIYSYKNILIDTDLEPDDKGALLILFRALYFYKQKHPEYVYPDITIIAGSSTRPDLKVKQADAIIRKLTDEGFIPPSAIMPNIQVIKGSPTPKNHPHDGKELLHEETIYKAASEDPDHYSLKGVNAIRDFLRNPKQVESLYISLREVKDLDLVCREAEFNDGFNKVDFMATLPFNVTNVYLAPRNSNEFVTNIVSKFRQNLCYENFHSVNSENSTGKAWRKDFKLYLLSPQGKELRAAGELWDRGNIKDCIETLSNPDYEESKTNLLGIDVTQAKKAHDLFLQVWNESRKGKVTSFTEETFKEALFTIFGESVKAQIETEGSATQQAFNPNFISFCSMVFNAPQLCLADIAFMGLICHPELLAQTIQFKQRSYNGRFSTLTERSDSKISFVMMDPEQLYEIGKKVTALLQMPSPQNILVSVLNFLPAYQYIGKNTIRRVCHQWNYFINENELLNKKPFEAIFEVCLSSPERVLSLICEDATLAHVSWDEFLQIVSCNEALSKNILSNAEMCGFQLDADILTALSKIYPSVVELILETPDFKKMLRGQHLALLGKAHLSIALKILADSDLLDMLNGFDLAVLGSAHESIAKMILKNSKCCEKLYGYNLATSSRVCPITAEHSYNLATLGSAHESVALEIVNNSELCEMLGSYNITRLGMAHLSMAKQIINTPALYKLLTGYNLASIARAHPNLSEEMNQIDEIRNKVNEYHLSSYFQSCLSLADKSKSKSELTEALYGFEFVAIGKEDLTKAREILKVSAYHNKLNSYSLYILERFVNFVNYAQDVCSKMKKGLLTYSP